MNVSLVFQIETMKNDEKWRVYALELSLLSLGLEKKA